MLHRPGEVFLFGPFQLETAERRLLAGGVPVHLTPKTFDVLTVLVQHSGRLVTKQQLMDEVWPDTFVGDAALTRCVADVRKALRHSANSSRMPRTAAHPPTPANSSRLPRTAYIETVSKQGYRFIAPVEKRGPTPAAFHAAASSTRFESRDNANAGFTSDQRSSVAPVGRMVRVSLAAILLMAAAPLAARWSVWIEPQVAASTRMSPRGWIATGSAPHLYRTGIDTSAPFAGNASGVLRTSEPSPDLVGATIRRLRHAIVSRTRHDAPADVFGTMMQLVRADAYRGKRVRLGAYGKSRDVVIGAGLWMRIDGADKRALAFDNMTGRRIRGTTNWTRWAVVLDVPADAALIAFGVLVTGPGELWVDDFVLETVGHEVRTTGLKPDTRPAKVMIPANTPMRPVNLGFEADVLHAITPSAEAPDKLKGP
ncbi:MAG: transcriptional regulator [Acidobacteria bacterium]|nr:transcriptional regulator [Acidobacteriota bacterium]